MVFDTTDKQRSGLIYKEGRASLYGLLYYAFYTRNLLSFSGLLQRQKQPLNKLNPTTTEENLVQHSFTAVNNLT
ncbi:hypothetical protein BsWGS_07675 [Bradybaena similaris]